MPHATVKQPDGRFAIWSTIVDMFIVSNCTKDEAMKERMAGRFWTDIDGLEKEFADIEVTGRSFRWSPTYEEALQIVKRIHGQKTVDEYHELIKQPFPYICP